MVTARAHSQPGGLPLGSRNLSLGSDWNLGVPGAETCSGDHHTGLVGIILEGETAPISQTRVWEGPWVMNIRCLQHSEEMALFLGRLATGATGLLAVVPGASLPLLRELIGACMTDCKGVSRAQGAWPGR